MASSPVHAGSQTSLLKHTKVTVNSAYTAAPAVPALTENLLQRDVFDYDFSRERVFLEIAEAEIAAMRNAEEEEKAAVAARQQNGSDDELVRQSTKLSLSSDVSSPRRHVGYSAKPRSSSEEDVAAAISASLREY
ncbi:unnamed protein product [Hyaloperonospora brassicae]|uniref:Uncharacterized protein n=1 Tax=Hyaloperonospora brassicae TaxID=162125 RepID=A0AAV0TP50_HYABA|nr:unnamed protein product [Hyaloperonospora brassicae]